MARLAAFGDLAPGDINCCQPPPDLDLPALPAVGMIDRVARNAAVDRRMPRWRERPAFRDDILMLDISDLAGWSPAISLIRRISPEGSRICA